VRKRKEDMKSEKRRQKKRKERKGREINVIRASDNNAKFVACIQIIYS